MRRIVVEYNMIQSTDRIRNERRLNPEVKRIISWKGGTNQPTQWKELQCPQKSFYGIKGYYGTLGLPVLFYNVDKKTWHKDLPKSVNL